MAENKMEGWKPSGAKVTSKRDSRMSPKMPKDKVNPDSDCRG